MRTLFLCLAVMELAGCAADYREPDLPADHPANPSAASAAAPEPSQTLAITTSSPVSAPSSASAPHQGHDTRPPQEPAAHEHGAPTSSGMATPAALFACPMHPEVTSDQPDQRCPECGMKLKKQDGVNEP